ncbi:hypothetical protein [Pseudobacteriovorax antillogorgiicola]|uniref:Uncharacterized protein n=1 Tax=Pseudobacteriovorax antillogorgiicola TaxID=1513793 RepID=A0A1Y6C7S6_9BACT|nr:hypothetical protein [Pseudobacteriovorax antillogorgiicola]TCS50741.1 hypothetical protein EDD56_112124 [Pseudobacteriovorax antillogorgiicola]SMF41020.1 hypothetical protein SAMN06296036_112123 [Pseudobacteriovorax antillogorgiicola]
MKEKVIPVYDVDFYGTRILMQDFVIYLDSDLEEEEFDPNHPHKVPRYEMARVAIVAAVPKGESIPLEESDAFNGVRDMYRKACFKELSLEPDGMRRLGVKRILAEIDQL